MNQLRNLKGTFFSFLLIKSFPTYWNFFVSVRNLIGIGHVIPLPCPKSFTQKDKKYLVTAFCKSYSYIQSTDVRSLFLLLWLKLKIKGNVSHVAGISSQKHHSCSKLNVLSRQVVRNVMSDFLVYAWLLIGLTVAWILLHVILRNTKIHAQDGKLLSRIFLEKKLPPSYGYTRYKKSVYMLVSQFFWMVTVTSARLQSWNAWLCHQIFLTGFSLIHSWEKE